MSRQPGSVPYSIPPDPRDVVPGKIKDLQDQIDELRTARSLENSQIGTGGIQITDGGSLRVIDSNGVEVARIGALPAAFNKIGGLPQPGVMFKREDGTTAAFLGDFNPGTPPFKQSYQILDRTGNIIIADDTNGGKGVALPYLTFGAPESNSAPTDTTVSATFATLQSSTGYWMSAKMTGQILVRASDGTTSGEVRIVDASNVQVGSTISVGLGAFAWVTWAPVVVPGNFGDPIVLNFQARRTAGAGTIGIRASAPIGVQS